MRKIHADFQARLDSGATRMCRCWRVDRKDGMVLGFTDHDGDLSFDGVTFLAGSGMDASALQTATGLSVDNAQAVGALSTAAITEADIRAGKFDGAEVRHWMVDWERPDLRVMLFRGSFGEIRRSDGRFEVELRGLAETLNVSVGRNILRSCDRVLGDGKCSFDVTKPGFFAEVSVAAGSAGARVVCDGLAHFASDWFSQGQLIWLSGDNAGDKALIKSETILAEGRAFGLWQQPAREMKTGDRFRVVVGCDKSAETCRAKFQNFLNFRGFPHIPGEDWVTSYPKDGEIHDGGSQQ